MYNIIYIYIYIKNKIKKAINMQIRRKSDILKVKNRRPKIEIEFEIYYIYIVFGLKSDWIGSD